MIVLSYNIRGLGSAYKRKCINIIIATNDIEVILIQEKIMESSKVKYLLVSTLPGWSL